MIGDAPACVEPTVQRAEYSTVATLVPRVAVASVLILLVGTFATNNNNSQPGGFNHPMYFAMLAVAAIVTAASCVTAAPRSSMLYSLSWLRVALSSGSGR